MDKASACQHALALLGEINFEKHSAPDSLCWLLFPDIVRYANNATHWSFARSRRRLSPLAPPSQRSEVRAFRLPADCLKIISVINPESNSKIPNWDIYSGVLEVSSSSVDSVELIYTSDLLSSQRDLPDQAPDFCQYVIHMLAARLAPSITGQMELASMLEQKANSILATAIYKDARQTDSADQAPYFAELSTHIPSQNYW